MGRELWPPSYRPPQETATAFRQTGAAGGVVTALRRGQAAGGRGGGRGADVSRGAGRPLPPPQTRTGGVPGRLTTTRAHHAPAPRAATSAGPGACLLNQTPI